MNPLNTTNVLYYETKTFLNKLRQRFSNQISFHKLGFPDYIGDHRNYAFVNLFTFSIEL